MLAKEMKNIATVSESAILLVGCNRSASFSRYTVLFGPRRNISGSYNVGIGDELTKGSCYSKRVRTVKKYNMVLLEMSPD
jgi:hypothetical protein